MFKIAEALLTFTQSERSERSVAAWGPGARVRAPVGSRGETPGGGRGGKAAWSWRVLSFKMKWVAKFCSCWTYSILYTFIAVKYINNTEISVHKKF